MRKAELDEVDTGVTGVLGASRCRSGIEVEDADHGGGLTAGSVHEHVDEGEELAIVEEVALAVATGGEEDAVAVHADAVVHEPADVLRLPVEEEVVVFVDERGQGDDGPYELILALFHRGGSSWITPFNRDNSVQLADRTRWIPAFAGMTTSVLIVGIHLKEYGTVVTSFYYILSSSLGCIRRSGRLVSRMNLTRC